MRRIVSMDEVVERPVEWLWDKNSAQRATPQSLLSSAPLADAH
jgi:hypothetical protein